MHGSYRQVSETRPALELLGQTSTDLGAAECRWFLDRPVSNSGRLKALMEELAAARGWPWRVELVPDPDAVLAAVRPGRRHGRQRDPRPLPALVQPRPARRSTAAVPGADVLEL